MKVDRVLVPLDGSPLAERAIPKALELLSGHAASTIPSPSPFDEWARGEMP